MADRNGSTGKQELRIFIAHAKSDDGLAEMLSVVTLAVRKTFPNREPVVTLGRDDYERNFQRAGSWDAWTREVAIGVHPTTREPRYHGIVVPGEARPYGAHARVGAATQSIVGQALGMGKPVLLFANGTLTQAKKVVKVAPRDFKTGWEVS